MILWGELFADVTSLINKETEGIRAEDTSQDVAYKLRMQEC
jgi:hypothetical protein